MKVWLEDELRFAIANVCAIMNSSECLRNERKRREVLIYFVQLSHTNHLEVPLQTK